MNNNKITFEKDYDRLDKALAEEMQISRSKAQKLIKDGCVILNGQIAKSANQNIHPSDVIKIKKLEKEMPVAKPSSIDLDIVYEDEDIIVVNKQAGLTVHPGAGNHEDTLVNALINHYGKNLSSIGGEDRPGIVHRLDRDTTGLMIIAKNDKAHEVLSKAIENREVKRYYKVFVWGIPKQAEDTIITNMDRSRADRKRRAVCREPKGKRAVTHYTLLESYGKISLLECRLETGRTHQIRVHMSHIGHSVIGDQLYGNNSRKILHNTSGELKEYLENFTRQALHSYKLEFNHPITGKELSFEAPLPEDLEKILHVLNV